ncbi:MAG: 3-hydroxyacyl-ACP dehydratase FabZ [Candidatus Taylorbacteria bacterium]|nr:3-hydroxyacyl-ACP dehydratase FabZ [Candidatus Taylorbacteria bacterium]
MVENLLNKDIRDLIPHREPFIFIDKVLSVESGCIIASKYIKKDEEYFKGHFPGQPIVPGVLIIESMAQTSGIACALYLNKQKSHSSKNSELYFLSRISDVKFKRAVLPGDTLVIKSNVLQYFDPLFKVQVSCEVNGEVVVEGELVLTKQKGGAV